MAALIHALWNRGLHSSTDRMAALTIANFGIGLALLPAILIAPPWDVWGLIGLSGAVQAGYAFCLAAAYHRGALAIAYPLGRGTSPLLVALGSWIVLAQVLDGAVLVGTIALAVGIAIIAGAGWRVGQGSAVGFALLAGLTIASYSLIDARAVSQVPVAGYFAAACLVAGSILALILRPSHARLRQALHPGLRLALGIGSAYLLVLLAFQHADAARVSALRESSILIAIWLARDRPTWHVWVGGSLVVGGVILAAFG